MKLGLQFIRIIGECFEILALHDYHAGVVGRSDIDFRGGVGNLDFFLLHLNDEADVQLLYLAVEDLDIFLGEESEALGDGLHGVSSWRQAFEFVETFAAGGGVQ